MYRSINSPRNFAKRMSLNSVEFISHPLAYLCFIKIYKVTSRFWLIRKNYHDVINLVEQYEIQHHVIQICLK